MFCGNFLTASNIIMAIRIRFFFSTSGCGLKKHVMRKKFFVHQTFYSKRKLWKNNYFLKSSDRSHSRRRYRGGRIHLETLQEAEDTNSVNRTEPNVIHIELLNFQINNIMWFNLIDWCRQNHCLLSVLSQIK